MADLGDRPDVLVTIELHDDDTEAITAHVPTDPFLLAERLRQLADRIDKDELDTIPADFWTEFDQ